MAGSVLTVEEVAEELRISRGSAYRLVNSEQAKDLNVIRVGRTIRVPRTGLDRFLQGGIRE